MADSKHLDNSSDKYGVDVVGVIEVPHGSSSSHEGDALQERLEHELNHRKLGSRQVQLTSIAGSIGAMLFVSIGGGISSGGVCLFVAYLFWCSVVFGIAQCQLEIVTMFPLDGSFIRLAGRMVDPAFGVAAGWNHFFAQASYVIFEATIINTLVEYWGYDQSPAILISISLALYFALNIWRADLFGEAEFWIALGKLALAVGLMFYTLITMCGGNPMGDKFGFRNWKETPWVGTDASSQFRSFLNAVIIATFTMAGPEYISMLAGEAKQPRKTIKRAFKTIMLRLVLFNIIGAVSVSLLVPVNDPTLTKGSDTYAGGSPYIISMKNLGIKVLPSVVTAALLVTIISAGNAYTFGASRSLHAMALDGTAPKFLRITNKRGVPYPAVCCVGAISLLAYLALGSTSATVLSWITNFCTAATLFNWCVMSFTYIRFDQAMKAQGIDKKQYLPVTSRWTPWIAYWSFGWSFIFIWVQGYGVFLNGKWKVATFIFNYGIIALAALIGVGFKIFAKTKFQRAKDIDLVSDVEFFQVLDDHYKHEKEIKPDSKVQQIVTKVF